MVRTVFAAEMHVDEEMHQRMRNNHELSLKDRAELMDDYCHAVAKVITDRVSDEELEKTELL